MSLDGIGASNVSVVVVNHNAGELLLDCVRSACKQALQVIVVDNASTDASLTELENTLPSASRLLVIRRGHNSGFSAGCNIGVKAATGAYILFLNPDCILGADSLRRMLQALEMDPRAGMVGGLLTDPDGSEQAGGRRAMPTPWRSFVHAFGLTRFAGRCWCGVRQWKM